MEKSIEEDKPKLLASGTSGHNMDMYQPYDHPQDGELGDQNGLYLTHQKGERLLTFVKIYWGRKALYVVLYGKGCPIQIFKYFTEFVREYILPNFVAES